MFQFVEINAMKLTDPHHAYSYLWKKITGKRSTPAHSAQLLDKKFSARKIPPKNQRTMFGLIYFELIF
jgi:hypothetical protein